MYAVIVEATTSYRGAKLVQSWDFHDDAEPVEEQYEPVEQDLAPGERVRPATGHRG